MKHSILILTTLLCSQLAFSQTNPAIKPYVDFLETQNASSVDYTLSLFENNDFVVISDRYHAECTQFDFFFDVIADPRFIEMQGKFYTEIGNQQATQLYENLTLAQQKVDDYKSIISNICKHICIFPYWEKRNIYDFLVRLYEFNVNQPVEKRVLWMGAQKNVDWTTVENRDDFYQKYEKSYDLDMATNIYRDYRARNGGKSLVVMNTRHSYKVRYFCKNADSEKFMAGAAHILINTGKKDNEFSVAVVLLNSFRVNRWEKLIDGGKWDAAFKSLGNKSLGFDLADSPFGELACDFWDKFNKNCDDSQKWKYSDVFDGFVFYNPLEQHFMKWNYPEWFEDDTYVAEYKECMEKLGSKTKSVEKIKKKKSKKRVEENTYSFMWLKKKNINKWLE